MPKSISWRKLVKKFRDLGFDGPYSLKVRIPNLHQSDISAGLVAEILRQAGVSNSEWENIK